MQIPVTPVDMTGQGIRWIHFTDNALCPETLSDLAHTRSNVLWFGFARFEDALMDPWLVRRLHRSGRRMLQLGLESGPQWFLNQSILNLPHGAPELEDVEHFALPGRNGDLSLYTDFRCTRGMDRKQAKRFLLKVFRRHPLVVRILRREPPAFTSSHAALFLSTTRP